MTDNVEFSVIDELPFYVPWIGGGYQTRKQMNELGRHPHNGAWFVHVMAESHYSDDYEDTRDLTQRVVAQWGFRPGATFTKIIQAVQGRPAAEIDRSNGWADIAFSNFVQQVLTANRQAPTYEHWEEGRRCFLGQLSMTRPRVCLVMGERLWAELPRQSFVRLPVLQGQKGWAPVKDACVYGYWAAGNLHLTLTAHVPHPTSSKFNWSRAHEVIRTLDMAHDNIVISMREEFAGASAIIYLTQHTLYSVGHEQSRFAPRPDPSDLCRSERGTGASRGFALA